MCSVNVEASLLDTSRETCLLRSIHVRLVVPYDWVVTRGLLRGRFWLCIMTYI